MSVLGFDRHDGKLMWTFFSMNIRDKYLGSSIGSAWAVVNPLIMLGVVTFVFGYVFKVRLPGAETTLAYAAWLISGYGPWLATVEAITAASLSVVASAGLVKNMPFKTELLPVTAALTGLVPLGVSLGFLAVLLFADGNTLTWHAAFGVVVAALQFSFIIALGFFMSAITVFVRDFGFALPNILMAILFATPIFYPVQSTPAVMQTISAANPFYIIAEGYRRSFIYHLAPDAGGLLYVGGLSLALALVGLRLFRRCKGNFEARL
ncbi:MAG: ABC transporter permease [Nitrospirae bacterium]|nr:MAG: ABC transporter permease [Nitrospirota bacterium]